MTLFRHIIFPLANTNIYYKLCAFEIDFRTYLHVLFYREKSIYFVFLNELHSIFEMEGCIRTPLCIP